MEQKAGLVGKMIRYAAVLLLVTGASGTGVGVLYYATKGKIEEKHREVFQSTLKSVFPAEVAKIEALPGQEEVAESERIYRGVGADGTALAYAAMGKAQGYQSVISVVASVRPKAEDPASVPAQPTLVAMRVVFANETPGLGQNVEKVVSDDTLWMVLSGQAKSEGPAVPAFQAQFSAKRLDQLRVVKQDEPDKIVALTGATISSRATTAAVREAVGRIVKAVGKSGGASERK
jgi:Na+-translocating ferredoxin:NAD+ oxidoreductase RnfG subunit